MDVDENDNLSVSNEVSKFVSGEVSERNNVLEPDRKRVTIEIKLWTYHEERERNKEVCCYVSSKNIFV